jgi:hypothetical protein
MKIEIKGIKLKLKWWEIVIVLSMIGCIIMGDLKPFWELISNLK